ncbi:REP-associated tyrosine transposase [Puniceicoccus vermicola]|uniref:Transposase IS200-like domain-containing protein n=2 Tax=Puniceicoccus vermicola TaxID=388746 RepID=A0A7X1AZ56_9BACT|nr:hypothetical protein [Puniceicoccus vermicola]
MSGPWSSCFLGVYNDSLPHWVVDCGCYAVTLRCQGSLPISTKERLREISDTLRQIDPASDEAKASHRRHFAILEQALDRAEGFCPFTDRDGARAMMEFLDLYDSEGLSFDHWIIMPNHLHLVTAPLRCSSINDFRTAWSRFKSRSARAVNRAIGREGQFWQSSWYDRWIRGPEEHQKWLTYLMENPVKAGLCRRAEDYPYRM